MSGCTGLELRGSDGDRYRARGKSQKILGKNLDKNPEYAVLSERTVPRLRQILRELQFREYVEEKGEQYPVICLTPEGKAFMKTEEPLIMKLPKEET